MSVEGQALRQFQTVRETEARRNSTGIVSQLVKFPIVS